MLFICMFFFLTEFEVSIISVCVHTCEEKRKKPLNLSFFWMYFLNCLIELHKYVWIYVYMHTCIYKHLYMFTRIDSSCHGFLVSLHGFYFSLVLKQSSTCFNAYIFLFRNLTFTIIYNELRQVASSKCLNLIIIYLYYLTMNRNYVYSVIK